MDGQGTKCRRNIAENYNRLSRVHERYRQTDRQTDGRQHIAKFTFANRDFLSSAMQKWLNRSICHLSCRVGCMGRRKRKFNHTRQIAPMCAHERTHWRHMANTIQPSVCGGDADLCQITLTTYYYAASQYYIHSFITYVDAAYCYRPSSVVCRSVTLVSPAKTAEPIEMPFGLRT